MSFRSLLTTILLAITLAPPALAGSSQLVVVTNDLASSSLATIHTFDNIEGRWKPALGAMRGVIGRNGFAYPGEKREGDGMTPSGMFPLGLAFGYADRAETGLPYRQMTQDDIWVDDPASPDYNRLVSRGASIAASFEEMRRTDDLYSLGMVVEYNTQPVRPGMGSAIFFHLWMGEGRPTSGCVATSKEDMEALLRWLRAEANPQVLMGTRADIAELAELPLAAPSRQEAARGVYEMVGTTTKKLYERVTPAGYAAAAVALPQRVLERMKEKRTWREGCPVAPDELAYLVLTHLGFDGKPRVGELVVHRELAADVVDIFSDLFESGFRIEKMELIEKYDGDDHRSMEANNTSAFNCREVSGKPGVMSLHAWGTAIDLNPVQNPYVVPRREALKRLGWDGKENRASFIARLKPTGASILEWCLENREACRVSPPNAAPFLARKPATGIILEGDATVKGFTGRGFSWGGSWKSELDYQHFDKRLVKR